MHKANVYTQAEIESALSEMAARDLGCRPPDVHIRIAVVGPGAIIATAAAINGALLEKISSAAPDGDDIPDDQNVPATALRWDQMPARTEKIEEWYLSLTQSQRDSLAGDRLIPAVRDLEWARVFVYTGKNVGKFLGELDDDQLSGYEKVFCPKYLDAGVKLWRTWKNEQAKESAPPAEEKPTPRPGRLRAALEAKLAEKAAADPAPAPDATPAPEPAAPAIGSSNDDTPASDENAGVVPQVDAPEVPSTGPEPVATTTARVTPEGQTIKPDDFAFCKIHFGKNKGKEIGELTPEEVHWYETDWMPKKRADRDRPYTAEDAGLFAALTMYRDWRHGSNPPPAEPGSRAAFNRSALLEKMGLRKSPASTSEPATPVQTVPAPEKPASVARSGHDAANWGEYALPIGNLQSKGGSRGMKLKDLPLDELREIKAMYLDLRPWNEPAKLAVYDLDLKTCIEAGLANNGKEPAMPIIDMPQGVVRDLYQRLQDDRISPMEFLKRMQEIDRLGPLYVTLAQITIPEAEGFLKDWDATLVDFDGPA